MRCKPGDLAVIVSRDSPNYGRFVTVRCVYDGRKSPTGHGYSKPPPDWIIDPIGDGLMQHQLAPVDEWVGPYPWLACWDSSLRPIRDQPGVDETLTSKPVPADEYAHG